MWDLRCRMPAIVWGCMILCVMTKSLAQDSQSLPVTVLSPTVKVQPLPAKAASLAVEKGYSFLNDTAILTAAQRAALWPIFFPDPGERLFLGVKGERLYSPLPPGAAAMPVNSYWVIYRPGPMLDGMASVGGDRSPQIMRAIGQARLIEIIKTPKGSFVAFELVHATEEIEESDRLGPLERPEGLHQALIGHRPAHPLGGRIVAIQEDILQMGLYDVLTLEGGVDQGRALGEILTVVRNPGKHLPVLEIGTVMVVRLFPNMSIGLVIENTIPIEVTDRILGVDDAFPDPPRPACSAS